MSEPRVTVVVPNWNGLAYLDECIAALQDQTFRDFHALVIDNASSDSSVSWLKEHAPDVEVVVMPRNGGFCYAVNEGIRRARGQYVALLTNDTAAAPGWLDALVAALDAAPDYDFAASRMVFYDEPDRLYAAGDVFSLTRLEGANRGHGRRAAAYSKPARVFGACASAALYRRALFDAVGLFDEDYLLMREDTEMNLRALVAGKRCLYVPGAVVRHRLSDCAGRQPREEMRRLSSRNQMLTVAKDFPRALLPVAAALWPVRTLRATVWPRDVHGTRQQLAGISQRLWADLEGTAVGWRKRHQRPPRAIGMPSLLRWLAFGSGRS